MIPSTLAGDAANLTHHKYVRVAHRVSGTLGCGAPLDAIECARGHSLLDIGCGSGHALLQASERVGTDGLVIGVDIAYAMVVQARGRIRANGVNNACVLLGLMESLPLRDASIDRVVSNSAMYLSPEKDRVFAEMARVMKPGGRFCIADIVVDRPPAWLRTLLRWPGSSLARVETELTYTSGLTAAGFTDIRVDGRVAYDASRMRAFVDPNLPRALWRLQGLAELIANTLAKAGWRVFRGRLASVRITGMKPD